MPTKAPQTKIELSQEGLVELQAELTELAETKLPAVIDRVAKAREYGDLSENAEYHSARDEQQLLQARIDEIQEIIDNSVVIKNTNSNLKVGMGSQVELLKNSTKKSLKITIVGDFEADPVAGKISGGSPLGKAVLGKKKGDAFVVKAPVGDIEYTVVEIK